MNQKMDLPRKESKTKREPLIHGFLASPLSGEEIEARSMERIEKEVPSHSFGPEEWQVVRRMIHTTGDFGLIDLIRFSPGAISHGIEALRSGRTIYVDSRMIQAGLSLKRLQSAHKGYQTSDIYCHVDDEEVFEKARQQRLPRSLFAVQKARSILNGGLVVFGNSPVGLLEINRLIQEEEIRPALVIAMPVGFVHVIESKEELMSLEVPFIALSGRRGGSPLAVSVVHALCSIAATPREGKSFSAKPTPPAKDSKSLRDETIILMGHGSRVPGAGRDMEEVAQRLKDKYGYPRVEICFISRLGPHFPEIFEKCVKQGAEKVLAIPYFLHEGLHLLLDIPEMMQKEANKFPHVKLMLGKSLGFDEGLVDLVERRIEESKDLCDVKDLTLPGREEYPIPPGQCEFVPMLPDEAAKYRG
ncbi:MAG TPA: precorrin-8X methylmutase [Thermodesulfobacteriota bacterium]|nr:precorrin-8X methylmutase [Thermodesulfobacteriota bacterium]